MRSQKVHISSVVVRTAPERSAEVEAAIALLEGCEVFHAENGKIVVVIEGPSSGVVGDRLAAMSLLDGVYAAGLVYEQVETLQSLGEEG
jgi:periplasmic nitrate reductase NapD